MSSKKYYYAFNGKIADGYNSFCIVSAGFWQRNKKKELDYTSDGNIASRIEKLGFIESMQNIFEYEASKYSEDDIKEKLSSIKNLVYNEDFQEYLTQYNIEAALEKEKSKKKKNDRPTPGVVFDDYESAKQSKSKVNTGSRKPKQTEKKPEAKSGNKTNNKNKSGSSSKSRSHRRRGKKKI